MTVNCRINAKPMQWSNLYWKLIARENLLKNIQFILNINQVIDVSLRRTNRSINCSFSV